MQTCRPFHCHPTPVVVVLHLPPLPGMDIPPPPAPECGDQKSGGTSLAAIGSSWPAAGPEQTLGTCPAGGSYQLHAEVGRGASGTVYHATETCTGRSVAVKVVNAYDLENSPELARDAELAAMLHENAIDSHSTGQQPPPSLLSFYGCWLQPPEGDLWVAMELCEGGPVSELLYSDTALCCARVSSHETQRDG